MPHTTQAEYLLGHTDEELRRLEQQAAMLSPSTRTILTLAGIRPGMRVLDLGTGAGDVAFEVAEIVGSAGSVIAVDRSTEALARAELRRDRRGVTNCTFVEGDILAADIGGPFDAVVGRLVLLYVSEPEEIVRRYSALIRPGGVYVAMEYEMTVSRSIPAVRGVEQTISWVLETFRRSGLDTSLGARLQPLLAAAGLEPATVLGQQRYIQCGDRRGPMMLAGMVRTLLPAIVATGVATADEVGIETLEQRLVDQLVEHDAILLPPTLVGAWTTVNG